MLQVLTPDIFYGTIGSKTPKIIIVGEAWGKEEAYSKLPFSGQSGRELHRMLGEAWKHMNHTRLIEALKSRSARDWHMLRERWMKDNHILMTNVIAKQPTDGNDFTDLLYSNDEVKARKKHHEVQEYHGVYPKDELSKGIRNLWALIDECQPDLVIAAGNWPLHVLSEHCTVKTSKGYKLPSGVVSWRGSQTYTRSSPQGKTYRLLPIVHPAAILREWGYRHVTVHDLRSRAGRFLTGTLDWDLPPIPGAWRPGFDEARDKLREWLRALDSGVLWLSVDLETYQKRLVTCLGLTDGKYALCLPFFYFADNKPIDYWKIEEEIELWILLKKILEHKNVRIIGQNFIYDTQFLHRYYGIEAIVSFDTMVAHHLAFPGTPKALEYLASLYCGSYCYWKEESEEWAANEVSAEELWQYNCKDILHTYEIAFRLMKLLKSQSMDQLYSTRLKAWKLARKMMIKGCAYNDRLRNQYRGDLYRETNELEKWLLKAVPPFAQYASSGKPWYKSGTAQQHLFYNVLGFKPILHKKTKRPTLDDDALTELAQRPEAEWLEPLFERLSELRRAVVSASNFLSVILGPTGRIHSQFNLTQTQTFRWSSKDNSFGEGGNLQNLPTIED